MSEKPRCRRLGNGVGWAEAPLEKSQSMERYLVSIHDQSRVGCSFRPRLNTGEVEVIVGGESGPLRREAALGTTYPRSTFFDIDFQCTLLDLKYS